MKNKKNLSISHTTNNLDVEGGELNMPKPFEESIWNVLGDGPANFELFDDTFSCSDSNAEESEEIFV